MEATIKIDSIFNKNLEEEIYIIPKKILNIIMKLKLN